jgi:HK97 family phage prohead protease
MTRIAGLAWAWDVPVTRWGWTYSIKRGAFRDAIKASKTKPVPVLWGHSEELIPVGTITSMREDETGLWFNATLIDTELAADLVKAIRAGAVMAPSVSFPLDSAEMKTDNDAETTQFIRLGLREISAVTFAAHPAASLWIVDDAAQQPNSANGAQEK